MSLYSAEYVDSATLMFAWYRRESRYHDNPRYSPQLPAEIFEGLCNLQRITHVELCNFPLAELPKILGNLITLERPTISGSEVLNGLPSRIGRLQNMKELRISGCSHLTTILAKIGKLDNLEHLGLYGCLSLTTLPLQLGDLRGLKRLELKQLMGLELLPQEAFGSLEAL
jgi:Leucine-rich repeat (LRR) protein